MIDCPAGPHSGACRRVVHFPKRGEIFLVRLASKPKDVKNRPALVVSLDIRNRLAGDIIVVPLSTNLRPAPTHVFLQEGEGGLSKPSVAKCEQLTTIDKALLLRGPFAGRIDAKKMAEVEKAIMVAVGIFSTPT
jgi:mRNA-degrading endonuclease toxin of MazEF toxin-antitoxin module